MANQIQVTIPQILSLLDQGKTRDEIAEHFNVKRNDVNKLFKHPQLAGKKPRKLDAFVIVEPGQEAPVQEDPSFSVEPDQEDPSPSEQTEAQEIAEQQLPGAPNWEN